ncbi:hypothetical protein LXL04_030638 [Taraxacum kok-saghyz]
MKPSWTGGAEYLQVSCFTYRLSKKYVVVTELIFVLDLPSNFMKPFTFYPSNHSEGRKCKLFFKFKNIEFQKFTKFRILFSRNIDQTWKARRKIKSSVRHFELLACKLEATLFHSPNTIRWFFPIVESPPYGAPRPSTRNRELMAASSAASPVGVAVLIVVLLIAVRIDVINLLMELNKNIMGTSIEFIMTGYSEKIFAFDFRFRFSKSSTQVVEGDALERRGSGGNAPGKRGPKGESRPNTIGRGPDHVGATAAMAVGFTKPFLAARIAIVAACPPPIITNSFAISNRLNGIERRFTSPASSFYVLSSKSPKLEPGTLEAIARPRDSSLPSLFSIAGAWKQSRDRRFPSPASTSAGSNREAGSNRDSSPPSLFSPAPASSKNFKQLMLAFVDEYFDLSKSYEARLQQLQKDLSLSKEEVNRVESSMLEALGAKNGEIEALVNSMEMVKKQAALSEGNLASLQANMESIMRSRELTETRMMQDGNEEANTEISHREKARLKEMQRLKRQMIQDILDQQKENHHICSDLMLCWRVEVVIEPSPSPSSPGLLSNKRVELEHEPSLDTL